MRKLRVPRLRETCGHGTLMMLCSIGFSCKPNGSGFLPDPNRNPNLIRIETKRIITRNRNRSESGFSGRVGSGFPDPVYMPRTRRHHEHLNHLNETDENIKGHSL